MTDFVRFVEDNEQEGESWNFWLQLDDNEEQIDVLSWKLNDEEAATSGFDFPYSIKSREVVPEHEVDILVRYSDEGYMLSHNKVTGKLVIPVNFRLDDLYKGGIRSLFSVRA